MYRVYSEMHYFINNQIREPYSCKNDLRFIANTPIRHNILPNSETNIMY